MSAPVASLMKTGTGSHVLNKAERYFVAFLGFFVSCFVAASADVVGTAIKSTTLQPLNKEAASKAALIWGLDRQEWRKYEAIMMGKRGIWSPEIDPITALGIHATSEAERNYYADLYVKTEFVRVEGELAFQRAVDAAWKRNYSATPRLASYQRSVSGKPIIRYGIVVKDSCDLCAKAVQEYIGLLTNSAHLSGIDIYIADSGGDEAKLRRWVENNQIAIDQIQQGKVTINHGSDYAEIDHYPKVFAKEKGGRWIAH